MFFKINQVELPITLMRDHFRSTRIRVSETGIVVKTPRHASALEIMNLLKTKETWISKAHAQALKIKKIQDKVFYLNQEISVQYHETKRFQYLLESNHLMLYKTSKMTLEKALFRFYLSEAHKVVMPIFNEELKRLNLKVEKVHFRYMRNAWGRCSSKGIIQLNPKLVTCDLSFIRYVCIHELVHLTHMNHSKQFYALLALYMPNYQTASKMTPFHSMMVD